MYCFVRKRQRNNTPGRKIARNHGIFTLLWIVSIPVDGAKTPERKAEPTVGIQAERNMAAGVQLTLQLHGAA